MAEVLLPGALPSVVSKLRVSARLDWQSLIGAGELVPLPAFNRTPPPLAFGTAPHPLSSVGLEAAILWRVGLHEDT
jgi:hypothetical protein